MDSLRFGPITKQTSVERALLPATAGSIAEEAAGPQNQCYPHARSRKITKPSPILAVHAAANAPARRASTNCRRASCRDHEAVVVFHRALNDKSARNKLRNLKPLHRSDPQPESEPNRHLDFVKYESDPFFHGGSQAS